MKHGQRNGWQKNENPFPCLSSCPCTSQKVAWHPAHVPALDARRPRQKNRSHPPVPPPPLIQSAPRDCSEAPLQPLSPDHSGPPAESTEYHGGIWLPARGSTVIFISHPCPSVPIFAHLCPSLPILAHLCPSLPICVLRFPEMRQEGAWQAPFPGILPRSPGQQG